MLYCGYSMEILWIYTVQPRSQGISLFAVGKAGNSRGIGYRILNCYWSTFSGNDTNYNNYA